MNTKNNNLVLIILLLLLTSLNQVWSADVLSGRVYEGDKGIEPPVSKALSGVVVKLYGSNNSNDIGVEIGSTTTNSEGWYGLTATIGYEFYTIVEVDPNNYYSSGATSVDGTVLNDNTIQYSVISGPLSDQTLTGNKFWDKPDTPANNPPIADFSSVISKKVASFTDKSSDTDGAIFSWFWNFGDGKTSTEQNPRHRYSKFGNYSATLTVTDDGGASSSTSKTVSVTK